MATCSCGFAIPECTIDGWSAPSYEVYSKGFLKASYDNAPEAIEHARNIGATVNAIRWYRP